MGMVSVDSRGTCWSTASVKTSVVKDGKEQLAAATCASSSIPFSSLSTRKTVKLVSLLQTDTLSST